MDTNEFCETMHITDPICKDAANTFVELFNNRAINVQQSVDLLSQLLALNNCNDKSKKDAFITHLEQIKNDCTK